MKTNCSANKPPYHPLGEGGLPIAASSLRTTNHFVLPQVTVMARVTLFPSTHFVLRYFTVVCPKTAKCITNSLFFRSIIVIAFCQGMSDKCPNERLDSSSQSLVAEPSRRFSIDASLRATYFLAVNSRRRSSNGNIPLTKCSVRRSSLGEEVLRQNLLRKSLWSAINCVRESDDRLPEESESYSFEVGRRGSLGTESLSEHDFEEDSEYYKESFKDFFTPSSLGTEYEEDIFYIKRVLEKTYHPRQCLQIQPQVSANMVDWRRFFEN